MLTFIEWLKNKKNIVIEVGRMGLMTHEDIPDIIPQEGQIVIVMDKLKAVITNNDLYYVLYKTNDDVVLIPKVSVDQGKMVGEQVRIPRSMWSNFTLVNHLLTRKERTEKFGGKPTWIIGTSKDKWIANREAETKKQKRLSTTPAVRPELDPARVAQFKQQFTGAKEEDPQVAAARSWLRGI